VSAAPALDAAAADTDASTGDAGGGAAALASRPLDEAAKKRLVADAERTGSAALVIVKDGELVGEWSFGPERSPIQTMSITKSVISLAVGALIDAGKLALETPVSDLYPEWSKDDRRAIRVVHLLSHNSGLEEGNSTGPIYASRSFVETTLKTKLTHPPGTRYEYSNRAVNLLAGIVAKVSGQSTERYVQTGLFEPLGIKTFSWTRDRAGQAHGMAGLHLLPRDLARIGELVLDGGRVGDRELVSKKWIELSTRTPATVQPLHRRLGLLWWLASEWTKMVIDDGIVEAWREKGVEPALIDKLRPLFGKTFSGMRELLDALAGVLGDPRRAVFFRPGGRDLRRGDVGPISRAVAPRPLGRRPHAPRPEGSKGAREPGACIPRFRRAGAKTGRAVTR
jgi:CubicO group peptidase (beta-lactamase class C family)